MKKAIMMVVVVALVVCAFCTVALAADWTEFGNGSSNNSVTDAETPVSEDEAELKFKALLRTNWADGVSNVLIVGDYVYVGVGSSIKKFNKDGTEVDSATLTGSITFAAHIAYANGTLFAYVNDGTDGYIEAIDAVIMERVWVSEKMAGMNGFSPITISGGNLYISVTGYEAYTYLSGYVIGMTTTDDNTGSQDEIKTNTFAYDGGEIYYWNGAAVNGNVAIVGSQDGTLQTIDTTTGLLIDSYEVGERIASSITHIGTTAYFGTASGLGSITVQADGAIIDATYNLVNLSNAVTTTPIVYGGRIYVGTGDFTGGTGLAVIDLATMTTVYSAQIAGTDSYSGNPIPVAGIQGTPVLTTAYTGNTLYFAINAKPGGITMIKDAAGQTESDVATIFTPDEADQNATVCSFVAGEDGTIYYTNDSGYLFAVGKADEEEPSDEVSNPQTGDNSNAIVYIAVGILAVAALAFALRKMVKA